MITQATANFATRRALLSGGKKALTVAGLSVLLGSAAAGNAAAQGNAAQDVELLNTAIVLDPAGIAA